MPSVETDSAASEGRLGGCFLWFFWGVSLSFMTMLSLVLLVLLAASVTLNVYLGWELSGLEIAISRPGPAPGIAPQLIPTNVLAAIPTNTPALTPTSTPVLPPTVSPLEEQVATLSALATQVGGSELPATSVPIAIAQATPAASPTSVPTAVAIGSPPEPDNSSEQPASAAPAATPAAVAEAAQEFVAPASSSNTYSVIALEGQRDSRPAAEHGDLNLKLRDPQPIQVDLSLIDISGAGIDPNAPNLGDIFKEPQFVNAYTIHDWDWNCNCKGKLLKDDHLVLLGIKTRPGEPIFIPTKKQDIFGGKYYATLLYASEDSVTFVYSRDGTVAHAYSVHYLGLHTDPNLLALYRQSKGNEVPGLTLDTPVGVATDELIVAIRDKGKFMDVRSKQDWWR